MDESLIHLLQKWNKNPYINPVTQRTITPQGKIFKKYSHLYDLYLNPKFSPSLETSTPLTGNDDYLNSICLNNSETKKEINQIRNHYNKINVDKDTQLLTVNIRGINNFIKARILRHYISKGSIVLDLGCGKGGDLSKYNTMDIKEYWGVDISDKSIVHAKQRVRRLKPLFKTVFKIKDVYNREVNFHKKFDIISSQLSFHYAFVDDCSLKTAVQNIAVHLNNNGYFIMTVPNKQKIINLYKSGNLSNRFFKIRFPKITTKTNAGKNIYKKYYFTLVGSVDECVEYFVNLPKLEKLLLGYNIIREMKQPFLKYFYEQQRLDPRLYKFMRLLPPSVEEKEVISLYEIVVFRKIDN